MAYENETIAAATTQTKRKGGEKTLNLFIYFRLLGLNFYRKFIWTHEYLLIQAKYDHLFLHQMKKKNATMEK